MLRPLGKGGMGAVYEAVDTLLHNTVAVKQITIEGVEANRAFEREARLLAPVLPPMDLPSAPPPRSAGSASSGRAPGSTPAASRTAPPAPAAPASSTPPVAQGPRPSPAPPLEPRPPSVRVGRPPAVMSATTTGVFKLTLDESAASTVVDRGCRYALSIRDLDAA